MEGAVRKILRQTQDDRLGRVDISPSFHCLHGGRLRESGNPKALSANCVLSAWTFLDSRLRGKDEMEYPEPSHIVNVNTPWWSNSIELMGLTPSP